MGHKDARIYLPSFRRRIFLRSVERRFSRLEVYVADRVKLARGCNAMRSRTFCPPLCLQHRILSANILLRGDEGAGEEASKPFNASHTYYTAYNSGAPDIEVPIVGRSQMVSAGGMSIRLQ